MNHILCSLILIVFTSTVTYAQVLNVDRENGQDTVFKRNRFNINLAFSLDKQKRNLLEFNSQIENDFYFKRNSLIWVTLFQTDAATNGVSILENNGYFQMRLRDNDKKRIYPDLFLQYQWNGVWGLENRTLGGCNARFKFWEDKKDDLYAGLGLFYESEKWNPTLSAFSFAQDSLQIVYRQIPRLNLSAKTAIQLKEGIDLSASTFVQFPLNEQFSHLSQPRWFIDLNLFLSISKHVAMQIHYDHNFDNYRPLPIDKLYYNFNMGFQLYW